MILIPMIAMLLGGTSGTDDPPFQRAPRKIVLKAGETLQILAKIPLPHEGKYDEKPHLAVRPYPIRGVFRIG